jgi:hypothetical protein
MADDPETFGGPAQTADTSDREIAFILRLAAVQIEIALSETAAPVAVLAATLGRLGGRHDTRPAGRELQFQARLVQRLLTVRDALATRADVIGGRGPDRVTATTVHARLPPYRCADAEQASLNVDSSGRRATARQLRAAAAVDRADDIATPVDQA